MKILADENIDKSLVAWLRERDHDVLWMAESGPGRTDEEVLRTRELQALRELSPGIPRPARGVVRVDEQVPRVEQRPALHPAITGVASERQALLEGAAPLVQPPHALQSDAKGGPSPVRGGAFVG